MPYAVERKNSKVVLPEGPVYVVVSKETGKVKGTHATKAEAESHVRLLYGLDNEMTPRNRTGLVREEAIRAKKKGKLAGLIGRTKPPRSNVVPVPPRKKRKAPHPQSSA